MTVIKPTHLKIGDIIGIVSPSSTIKNFPRRLSRGIKNLEKLQLKVILGKNVKKSFGHNAGTPEERAEDIHSMFANPSVKAVICSTGGLNANAVLPLLDYNLIRKNPKIFCGYSDITILNNAIFHKIGLVTFNGPMVLPTFGEFGGAHKLTIDYFKKALFSNKSIGLLNSTKEFSDENLLWEIKDNRPKKMRLADRMYGLTNGEGQGMLLGGNLTALCFLGGTQFLPNFTDSILFLEDAEESTASIERKFFYLEQLGILEKIKGMMFARPYQFFIDLKERTLNQILKYFGEKYDIPVAVNLDFGHTSPMITLPLGINAKISVNDSIPEISVTEPATN